MGILKDKAVITRIEVGFFAEMPDDSLIRTFGLGDTPDAAREDLLRVIKHERDQLSRPRRQPLPAGLQAELDELEAVIRAEEADGVT
jgi:hypothetical protein